jgi:hypothetical protein
MLFVLDNITTMFGEGKLSRLVVPEIVAIVRLRWFNQNLNTPRFVKVVIPSLTEPVLFGRILLAESVQMVLTMRISSCFSNKIIDTNQI